MAKIGVFLKLDEDIVEGFKALAEATPGGKYQALINDALRKQLGKEEVDGLEARIAKLEATLKKKGIL